MISLKVLSTAAALALVLPVVATGASFAQGAIPPGMHRADNPAYRGPLTGGGGSVDRGGGAGTVGPNRNLGGPAYGGGGGGGRPQYNGGGGGGGGGYYRGGGGGGYYRGGGGGGGFIPGAVAGALIGGAIASGGGYYGGPAYAPGYYDDGYDDGAVAVAPGGDDSVGYCMQRFRSYDPRSGTYLGNDGYRHPCP